MRFSEAGANVHEKITLLLLTLLPLAFLPFGLDPFFFPKILIFVLLASLVFLFWLIRTLRTGQVRLSLSFTMGLAFVLPLVATISAFLTANPATQFTNRLLIWWTIPVFLLFGVSLLPKIRWSHVLQTLLAASALLSLLTLLQLTPAAPSQLLLRFWPVEIENASFFTLSGSILALLQLLIPVMAASIFTFFESRKKEEAKGPGWALLSAFGLAGIAASIFIILKNPQGFAILPFQHGWDIMIEGFKNPRLFFLGIGAENFTTAFHLFRSANYNMTDLWATRFSSSSTEALHIMSTLGLLGLASTLALLILPLRQARTLRESRSLFVFFVAILVMFFLTPFTQLTWILLGIGLFGLNLELLRQAPTSIKHLQVMLTAIQLYSLSQRGNNETGGQRGFSLVFSLLLLVLMGSSLLWVGRVYGAQAAYYLSLQSATANDGVATYNRQQLAKNLQPLDPQYRRAFASTSLVLAASLLQQENRTQEQEQMMFALIQQAIREGRNAVTLDPNATENWETLAAIYEQLLSIEGANEWALAARVTAVQTDPVAPNLRLALGDLYVQQSATPSAQSMYEQTIQLKPDWPIAYTRYGMALELLGQPALALASYQKAQELLPNDAAEADRAALQEKIAELQQMVAAAQAQVDTQGSDAAAQLPNPQSPTVPEQPELPSDQTPDDFSQVIDGNVNDASGSGDIVLPEDVGI